MNDAGKITAFAAESNRIEGIHREPTEAEIEEHQRFFELDQIGIKDLKKFVSVHQPNAALRTKAGMDVRVGDHIAPSGGPNILRELRAILGDANLNLRYPYFVHHAYERVHPFMDGNGRSGRALWAWQMLRFRYRPGIDLGFLHAWYYQSLARSGR